MAREGQDGMNFDAVIIGGSYAGISAGMQLARGRRTICVVDAGRPRNRFASASHGFFGHDGAPPYAMIAGGREQLLAYSTVTFIEGEAVSAAQDGERFVVGLASGDELTAARILLAHGVEDRLPDLAGVAERWGISVLHCPYCHGYEYGDRRLGVLNCMPGSIHQALLIPDWGPTTFFLNGAEVPDQAALDQLQVRGVTVEQAPVLGLDGDAPGLAGVRLADGRSVPIEALFIATTVSISPLAAQLGCELEETPAGMMIKTDAMKLTSVPGVYAAGDAARPFGNATFASADGAMAGAAIHQSLIFAGLS